DPMKPYEGRRNTLKSFDVNCQCRLCKLERSESSGIVKQRDAILERFADSIKKQIRTALGNSLFNSSHTIPVLIKQLKKMINDLDGLRKEHPELEFPTFEIKSALALVYGVKGDTRQSISVYQELYNFVKSHQIPLATSIVAFQLSFRYYELSNIKPTKKWFNTALKDLAEPIRG